MPKERPISRKHLLTAAGLGALSLFLKQIAPVTGELPDSLEYDLGHELLVEEQVVCGKALYAIHHRSQGLSKKMFGDLITIRISEATGAPYLRGKLRLPDPFVLPINMAISKSNPALFAVSGQQYAEAPGLMYLTTDGGHSIRTIAYKEILGDLVITPDDKDIFITKILPLPDKPPQILRYNIGTNRLTEMSIEGLNLGEEVSHLTELVAQSDNTYLGYGLTNRSVLKLHFNQDRILAEPIPSLPYDSVLGEYFDPQGRKILFATNNFVREQLAPNSFPDPSIETLGTVTEHQRDKIIAAYQPQLGLLHEQIKSLGPEEAKFALKVRGIAVDSLGIKYLPTVLLPLTEQFIFNGYLNIEMIPTDPTQKHELVPKDGVLPQKGALWDLQCLEAAGKKYLFAAIDTDQRLGRGIYVKDITYGLGQSVWKKVTKDVPLVSQVNLPIVGKG